MVLQIKGTLNKTVSYCITEKRYHLLAYQTGAVFP